MNRSAQTVLLLALCLLAATTAQAQTTYTVTNANDGGAGSLRAAITSANDDSGTPADIIAFDISDSGPHTIQLTGAALPDITDPVEIDGTSEPDYDGSPVVEIDGSSLGGSADGLTIGTNEVEIIGLSIVKFPGGGIYIDGNENVVAGCYIGLRRTGDSAGNGDNGIVVQGDANLIGRPSMDRNVISGNNNGIVLSGATNTVIQANYIGTNAAGDAAVPNLTGVALFSGDSDNLIGGTSPAARNVIAGNSTGIQLNGASDNTIQGNYIGTNAAGDAAVPNLTGVSLFGGASNNLIGGTTAGAGNVISGNDEQGILLTDSGTAGNTIRGNAVYANDGLGIDLQDDGGTANDAGDGDTGPNNLQNFPEIQSADYDEEADEVTVTYLVDTDPANAAYPLDVDFYQADADREEGKVVLGTDTYSESDYNGCGSPPCEKTFVFTSSEPVTHADFLLATATDASGNTSEFSASSQQLPVSLVRFTATASGSEKVTLAWRTASETNNARFEVQRARTSSPQEEASDAPEGGRRTWRPVGSVEGAGTTAEAQSYALIDRDLPFEAKRLTYRLVQYDLSGAGEVVGERTVAIGPPQAIGLEAPVPNPVRQRATLRYELPEKRPVVIAVYDALGRKVRRLVNEPQAGQQQVHLDATALPAGVYFVQMRTGSAIEIQRFVVVH